jgi:3-oxoacyl-[acyl-carrier-protein] synthase II
MSWAITGMGMVCSLGVDTASSLEAFAKGATSVGPLRAFDRSRYRMGHAYGLDQEGAATPWRASRWLGDSISQALAQARLDTSAHLRIAVLVGTGLAEQRSLECARPTVDELDFGRAVRDATGLTNTVTVVNACAAGLYVLAMATDLLWLGEADAVVVAAADSISESMFGLLDRVNAEPPAEVRPFDLDRKGLVLGEGAAALILEPVAGALARGAHPLATVRGVGTSCDAYHVTAPDRSGIVAAIRGAHRRAGVRASDVDIVLVHGTGAAASDDAEAAAMGEAFDGTPKRPLVTGLKSLIGHTSGASGLIGVVAAVDALSTGRVPPTRHHAKPVPAIRDFTVVTEPGTWPALRVAQVNAFGFGGVNAVALVSRDRPGDGQPLPPNDVRVVVTGLGVEIPGVASPEALLALVRRGQPLPAADFDPAATLGTRGLRYKDRATLLALCAADRALRSSCALPVSGRPSFGVVVSTQLAVTQTVDRVVATIHREGAYWCSPMDLPNVSGNVAAAQIAIWFQLKGLNLTISSGPTSGIEALRLAATAIRAGRATSMLVAGVEPFEPAVADLLRRTAVRHGGDPHGLGRFDGAAAVVLESEDSARARGARILARIGRSGNAHSTDGARFAPCDRHVASAPPGDGARFAPCDRHVAGAPPGDGELVVSRTVGEATAALGVLQCALAACDLTGSATLTAGGCWGHALASLVLEAPR